MNNKIMEKLYRKLSPKEYEKLRNIVYQRDKSLYHRNDLQPIKSLSLGLKKVPESIKMLRNWTLYSLHC